MSIPLRNEKHGDIEVTRVQDGGFEYAPLQMSDTQMEGLRIRDERLKRRIRFLRFAIRILSILMSGYNVATMAYALERYYTTRNHRIPSSSSNPGTPSQGPWGTSSVLWPTFLLLAVSVITFLANVAVAGSYCCGGVKAANKTDSIAGYLGWVITALTIVAWAVTTGLFKMANTGALSKDLWGYSCGDKADALQAQVQSFLNFGELCSLQTGAYYTTIIQIIIYLFIFITYIAVLWRSLNKRKMAKLQQEKITLQTF